MCPRCSSIAVVFAGVNPGDPDNGYPGGERMYRCVACGCVSDESDFDPKEDLCKTSQ